MRSSHLALLTGTMLAALTGCANMSGLDASGSFGCKAAAGVTCQSVSGVHQNAMAGNLPFQRTQDVPAGSNQTAEVPAYGADVKGESVTKVSPRDMVAQTSGMPIRQPPLVLRVWMAPYEDETGDLHDQSYFYTMVHSGHWLIEANRKNISNQFRPVYPLNRRQGAEESQTGRKEVSPQVQQQAQALEAEANRASNANAQ